MPSAIELCNLALSRIGSDRVTAINSLTENTKEAQDCAIKLPQMIRTSLRRTPWNFATRTVAMAFLGEGNPIFAFRYQYPTDCMFIQSIGLDTRVKTPYSVEAGADLTRNILCDVEQAILVYTVESTDPNNWDALYYDAFAWSLSAELAITISGSSSKAEGLKKEAQEAWSMAMKIDAKEMQEKPSITGYKKARQ